MAIFDDSIALRHLVDPGPVQQEKTNHDQVVVKHGLVQGGRDGHVDMIVLRSCSENQEKSEMTRNDEQHIVLEASGQETYVHHGSVIALDGITCVGESAR